MKECLLRCAHIAHIYIFGEIEHHRIKPCRAGIVFLFFSFFLAFFFFTSGIYTHTLPPQNHRQNALAMLYSKGSAPKKRGEQKRKNSLDHPHHIHTSPVCTFMSNANKTKRGATVSGLMTGLTPSRPLHHLSRHLRTSRRFHILQIILLVVRSSFFQHSVDSSFFESFLKGWVVSWNLFLNFLFLFIFIFIFFFAFCFLFLRFA